MLLRTGMLTDDMARIIVSEIIPAKQKVPAKGQLLSEVIKEYTAEKQAEWTAKTKMEIGGVFRLVQDVVGDIDMKNITKQTMLDMRSTLMRLPANLYKRYPEQTIKQILDIKDIIPMSIKSINKHMGRMGALLRYCTDEGIVAANCASGLKVSEKRRADEERSAYSIDDLTKILSNLPRNSSTPERYWIPLIGCYSGMRLNEICQLYVNDVLQVDDIWCININEIDDKRLKNIASERMIPVHPRLIELGFLEYVENSRKTDAQRLWTNLTWMDIHGYSNAFGKWFQRYNRQHVTTDKAKVFHSLRHTVTDTLKQAGIQEVVISEIIGHANDSMTMSRYGKRYQPKILLEAMKHLNYGVTIPAWKV